MEKSDNTSENARDGYVVGPSNERVVIASVLFLDIVAYSRTSVSLQTAMKQRFNEALAVSLSGVLARERIVVDSGDGAAIAFLSNPELALQVGRRFLTEIGVQDETTIPSLVVRLGINAGPVCVVKDINGNDNLLGDGINTAQRVMSFARPGQILVSASYHDLVNRLSDAYVTRFSRLDPRKDKHGISHQVYSVIFGESEAFTHSPAGVSSSVRKQSRRMGVLPWLGGALFLLLIGLWAVVQPPAIPPPASSLEPLALRPRELPPEVITPTIKPKPALEKTPPTPGQLVFAIVPWGEIYVDGTKAGLVPPLKQLSLSPGLHEIEVRNRALSHKLQVTIHSGETQRIRYRFE